MSDLIRREDLVKELNAQFAVGDITREIANDILNHIPSAEPERKKGTWEVQPSTGEDRPYIWWKCSECGHVIFSETERDRREFHAFCGRCGAEMTR